MWGEKSACHLESARIAAQSIIKMIFPLGSLTKRHKNALWPDFCMQITEFSSIFINCHGRRVLWGLSPGAGT